MNRIPIFLIIYKLAQHISFSSTVKCYSTATVIPFYVLSQNLQVYCDRKPMPTQYDHTQNLLNSIRCANVGQKTKYK